MQQYSNQSFQIVLKSLFFYSQLMGQKQQDGYQFTFLQQHRRMRKHSRFFSKNQNNIKHLLGQLAMKDLQSEQIKINQLVNKQKATLHAIRSLKTSTSKQPPKSRQKICDKSISAHNLKNGKENLAIQGNNDLSSKNVRVATDSNKVLKKLSTTRYQRYLVHTKIDKQTERDINTSRLPEISFSSKRNSLQKTIDSGQKFKKSLQVTTLDIIEETLQFITLTKKPSINFHLTETQKDRSLVNSKK